MRDLQCCEGAVPAERESSERRVGDVSVLRAWAGRLAARTRRQSRSMRRQNANLIIKKVANFTCHRVRSSASVLRLDASRFGQRASTIISPL